MISNFKLATKTGKRVAVFADKVDDKVEFFYLICSKRDVFSKKKAKEAYSKWKTTGSSCYTEEIHTSDYNKETKKLTTTKSIKETCCHPIIDTIDIEFTSKKVNEYLNSQFYKFIDNAELGKFCKELTKHLLYNERSVLESKIGIIKQPKRIKQ